jgi:hypothetical protein
MSEIQLFLSAFSFAFLIGIVDLGVFVLVTRPQLTAWFTWRNSDKYHQQQELKRIQKLEARDLKRDQRNVRNAAHKIRRRLEDSLTAQKMVWVYERQGAKRKMSRVKVRTILYSLDEVWLRIDDKPWGVTWNRLLKDEVLEDIRIDVGRKDAKWVIDEQVGVFLRTFLRSSISGIPKIYYWHKKDSTQTALANTPDKKPFAIPIGIGENRHHHWLDLDGHAGPHLIVGGSTGGGKSVFLNQVICTLLAKNSPSEMKLVLFDLKRVELWQYRSLPHLWSDIILQTEDVIYALEKAEAELERRTSLFQNRSVRSIDVWNETQPKKLPHIVLIFDEFASVAESPDGKKAIAKLVSLARLGRFAGFKIIFCTQRPSVEVIKGPIQSNVTTRVAFRTNNTGSQVILGSWEASQLPSVDGRCIYKSGAEVHEVQAPYITDGQIERVVSNATKEKKARESLTEDVFRYALQNYKGKCTNKIIKEGFDGKIPHAKIETIISSSFYDPAKQEPVFIIDNQRHILHQVRDGGRGKKPSYVIPLNGHDLPTKSQEIQEIFDKIKSS